MIKNLIGFVTFGNLDFTKLMVRSVKETVKNNYDLFCVVGKPGDTETINWLSSEGIPHIVHNKNMGFPYSINDIYDYAWVQNTYENLVIIGNDVIAYPYCIDTMINLANNSDYEVISSLQYDVKDLCNNFPEASNLFSGENKIFNSFDNRPWDLFTDYSDKTDIMDMQLYDIQNLCLYKKSIFNKVGYTDVGFFPAYFVDNDYARRIVNAKIKCCTLRNARFFHFWSRTIHQGSGGSNSRYFKNNEKYYKQKWGGSFGSETKEAPVLINDRTFEEQIIDYWR